jgi:protein OS-9
MQVDDSEYNFMILDPEHPYGSPYGGFSRSSASRLASLPLKLPNVAENRDDYEPFFMKVMDAFGKPFLCRAYHEDELDQSTLDDGMFKPPVLRKSNPEEEAESFDRSATDESSSHELNDVTLREKAKESLSVLKDVCAQHHQSWWSYEWCFEGKITQFHVRIEIDTGNNKHFTVEDVTGLGEFNGNSVTEVSNPNTNSEQSEQAPPRRDVEERAFFDEGDICPDTGLPRQAEAVLLCCPSLKSSRKRSTVFRNGNPFETDLVYLKSVEEEQVCTYTLTLCTPLLCHEELLQERQKPLPTASGMAGRKEIENVEDLSVSEVINLVFQGDRKSKCVIFSDGQW